MKTNNYAKKHYYVAKAYLSAPVLNIAMADMCKNNRTQSRISKRNEETRHLLLKYISKN